MKCHSSFEQAKAELVSSKVLMHNTPSLPNKMAGDASAYGVGTVIAHILPDGTEWPVAFTSCTLTSSEKNYAQVEKEALSLIFGIKRFNSFLHGRHFTLMTDHNAYHDSRTQERDTSLSCFSTAEMGLDSFCIPVWHKVSSNQLPDGLSRLPLSRAPTENNYSGEPEVYNISRMEALPVTVCQLRAATTLDWLSSKVFQFTQNAWPRQPFADRRNELTVKKGCLQWGDLGHRFQEPEGEATPRVTSRPPWSEPDEICSKKYMWPGLDKELENFAKSLPGLPSYESCTIGGSTTSVDMPFLLEIQYTLARLLYYWL